MGMAVGAFAAAALVTLTGDFADTATAALRRRYYRAIVLPIASLLLLLLFRDRMLEHAHAPWLRAVCALLPVLPGALLLYIVVRHVLALDDLQRRIEAESFAISALLVGLGALAVGSLRHAGAIRLPAELMLQWLFPLVCIGYLVARLLTQRRYR